MRSRDSAAPGNGDNPLARRFLSDEEPDTIDLDDPSQFHSQPQAPAESPTTQFFDEEPSADEQASSPGNSGRMELLTQDSRTGKFYVHPGQGGGDVLLNGLPVGAPTELRAGDRIGVGGAEFLFNAKSSD